MTITAAKLAVEISADTRDAQDGIQRAGKMLDRFASDGDTHLGRAGQSWHRWRQGVDTDMDGVSRHSGGMLTGMSSGFMAFAGGAAVTGVIGALAGIGNALIDLGGLAAGVTVSFAQAAIDWEAQFTAVKKTVAGTPEELDRLEQQLRALARRMPVSHEDLAQIAETAGQLGVPTANIADFTEQIAMLATATDMTAEQAATSMGRFTNIMGTPITQIGNLGAALVALGNAGASTESEIMDMALRLAAAGKQVGLTEGQVLGLSSALASVGIDAEAGGTAFSRVLTGMNQAVLQGGAKLDKFAQVSGMTAAEFARKWKTDPTQALDAFLKGLKHMSDQGQDVDQTLADLDFNDVRVTDALKRASQAGDLFGQSIKTGQQAMQDGTAARDEYAKFADTTSSKLEILKNNWNDFKISLGQQILNWAEPYINGFIGIAQTATAAIANGQGLNGVLEAIAGEHGPRAAAAIEKIVGVLEMAGAAFWGFAGIVRIAFGTAMVPITDFLMLVTEAVEHVVKVIDMVMRQTANALDAVGLDSWADQLRQAADTNDATFQQMSDTMTGWARFANDQVLGGFRMLQEAENAGAEGLAHYRGETTKAVAPVGILGNRIAGLAGEIFKVPRERTTNIQANINNAINGVNAVFGAIQGIPDRVVNIYVRAVDQVGSSISDTVARAIGRRASGGPVKGGGLYLVGEEGPELVQFGSAGQVLPASQTRRALAGGGPRPVNGGPSGGGGPLTVVLQVDKRRLGEATLESLNRLGGETTAKLAIAR